MTGPVELRLGADWRETEGETHELFPFVAGAPTRGRVAGGPHATRSAASPRRLDARRRSPSPRGGRIDRWRISDGRLHERVLATGAVLTDTAFPRPGRLGADRPAGPRLARAATR